MTNPEKLKELFPPKNRRPRNNGDHVRSMNNEALADFIWDTLSGFLSQESLLAYLNEEAKEEST